MGIPNDHLTVCQRAYDSTRELPVLKDPAIGFEILLTPPRRKPPLLLIGYQPGNAKSDMPIEEARNRGFEKTWPSTHTIVDGKYRLAARLRALFEEAPDTLRESVALNAIFIRHRDVEGYHKAYSQSTRDDIQQFCLGHVKNITEGLDPQHVLVIGLSTFALFDENPSADHKSETTKRSLYKRGHVFGREALAIPHLSGSRITREDFSEIKRAVLEYCKT